MLKIDRFGLNYDFIESNHLMWIDNLITGSGGCIAKVWKGQIVRGTTVNGKPHPNFPMAYVQEYLGKYGVRKCEANALVIASDASRDMCRQAIEKWLGTNAHHRFTMKRKATIEYIDKRLDALGLNKPIKEAIKAIDDEIGPEEEDE
jgi:hypothetical protein